jgi:predicted nucleic acid-binding Zn ribbon protein
MEQRAKRRRRYASGRWAVERERCRLPDPVQPAGECDPVRAGAAADAVLRGLRLPERDWQSEMLDEWVRIAGATVARHARPGKVTGSCLTVYVDSPVWLAEIARSQKGPLLRALQERFGAGRVASVRFLSDPDGPTVPGRTPTSGE